MSIRVRPTLGPMATRWVQIYDQTLGASGPYCCPEAVAAILDEIASNGEIYDSFELREFAAMLRGEV